MKSQLSYILRTIVEDDKSFIYNSFLKSYHKSYPQKLCPSTLYFKGQADIITFLFETAECLIACYPEDAAEILGYVIYQRIEGTLILHYIYIKNLMRRKYIASDIIENLAKGHDLIVATHIVDNFTELKYKCNTKIVYDPFLINQLRVLNDKR